MSYKHCDTTSKIYESCLKHSVPLELGRRQATRCGGLVHHLTRLALRLRPRALSLSPRNVGSTPGMPRRFLEDDFPYAALPSPSEEDPSRLR